MPLKGAGLMAGFIIAEVPFNLLAANLVAAFNLDDADDGEATAAKCCLPRAGPIKAAWILGTTPP